MSIAQRLQNVLKKDWDGFVVEVFREWLHQEPSSYDLNYYVSLLRSGKSKLEVLFSILYAIRHQMSKFWSGTSPSEVCINTKDWLVSFCNMNGMHPYYVKFDTEPPSIRYDAKTIWPSPYHHKFIKLLHDPPEQFVAVVPWGRVWGPNGAVCTPDHKLLWDISLEYNKQPYQHSIFSETVLPPLIKSNETVAVLTSVASSNYYHWLFDVLPRFELLRRSGIPIDRFIINRQSRPRFQAETLAALGIPEEKLLDCNESTHLEARTLVVSSMPGCTGQVPKWVSDYLKKQLLGNSKTNPFSGYERIYITRAHTKYRKVINEDEVIRFLEGYGFHPVALEFLTVQEEAQLFASAKVVVAPHGAGLTNLIYCNPGTKVVEIFAPNYVHPVYWVLSHNLGLDYYYLTGEGRVDPTNSLNVVEDIRVDLYKLSETLRFANVTNERAGESLVKMDFIRKLRSLFRMDESNDIILHPNAVESAVKDWDSLNIRSIWTLKTMMSKEGYDFVRDCYRELLCRMPGQEELDFHVNLLWSGMSKLDLALGIMQSQEAIGLYSRN
ncbi:glycosyltransferase 61 family protein [Paenibacillus hamazuiensis]|uniref:glycosyltransferase 61 family protein n=1 Tax=Paenibacillus hamazuiensis TaxID=2936508 RepID=UPI00200D3920|nr:glycosyltransferase 61 family protein [Paenibacillus hamazuiensis]